MVNLLNSSCARFDDVPRSGSRYELEAAVLYVKGTWLPSEFSISVCDGNDAWIGRASEDFVMANASILGLTDSEYVDTVQFCFSEQQPDVKYELKWAKNLSPELICYKDSKLVLRLQTTTDSGPRVAADMVQLLLEAHHGLTEELARKTRGFARDIAAVERSLKLLKKQLEEGLPVTNGHVNVVEEEEEEDAAVKTVPGTSSRAKRKGGATNAETGSRKRPAKTTDALPLFQKPASPVPLLLEPVPLLMEPAATTRPPPLSALGYKQQQPKVVDEHQTSKDPSWLEAGHIKEQSNGVTDDSLSEGHIVGGKKAFLDRLSDVAEPKTDPVPAKKASKKKQGKSGGKKSSKKVQPQPSLEDSLNQVEDVVEKGIQCVDNIAPARNDEGLEVSSPLTTPVKKTPASGKRAPKEKKVKEKKQVSSRSSRKKVKPVVVELEEASEPESEAPEIVAGPSPGVDEDREIDVQNAEFNDFDAKRTENSFEVGQFWALYDDQDGMPRFYGHVTGVETEPFQVSVEWLEPLKPLIPATGLVKNAKLSPACGEFTFGTVSVQALPAFSHVVEVDVNSKHPIVSFFPRKDEIWALYRHWDKKPAKKEDEDEAINYEYDLVTVASNYSSAEGVAVLPLIKVDGFKSLFIVAGEEDEYRIPNKQIQARFSHCIPQHLMLGSESPGVPPGAWELDPASTPSEYLGAQEGNADNAK